LGGKKNCKTLHTVLFNNYLELDGFLTALKISNKKGYTGHLSTKKRDKQVIAHTHTLNQVLYLDH